MTRTIDEHIIAIVVAGGRSQRMGAIAPVGGKAAIPFGDETMLERVCRTLLGEATRVIVVAAEGQALPPLPEGVAVTRDTLNAAGPLSAIRDGLAYALATGPRPTVAVIASCDIPDLKRDVVRLLVNTARDRGAWIVPVVGGHPQVLVSAIASPLIGLVTSEVASHHKSPRALLDAMQAVDPKHVVLLSEAEIALVDPAHASFADIDTPEDLAGCMRTNNLDRIDGTDTRSLLEVRPLSRAEVREVDRMAIETFGVPGVVLMENAGAGMARILEAAGIAGPVGIVCGKGNNGGDGFVVARHLDAAGYAVKLLLACEPSEIRGDAAVNVQIATRSALAIEWLACQDQAAWEQALAPASWIVDALLGTGAIGAPSGAVLTAINAINAVRRRGGVRVAAVDLPSGLDCDAGVAVGACVRADLTVTFVAPKFGFASDGAPEFTGEVHVVGIGAPRAALTGSRLVTRFA
jgi:NAD(P)H-hydrate epimerase